MKSIGIWIAIGLLVVAGAAALGQALLPQVPGQVSLPLQELIKLLVMPKPPAGPPSGYLVTSANYVTVVKEGKAAVSAKFEVDVLKDGWSQIALFREVAPSKVTINGKPAAVSVAEPGPGAYQDQPQQVWQQANVPYRRGGRWISVVTNQPGHATIEAEFLIPVQSERANSFFSISLPGAGTAALAVSVPEPGMTINISPAVQLAQESGDKETKAAAVLFPSDEVRVNWSRKIVVPEVPVGETKLYCNSITLFSVGEGLLRGWTSLNYSITPGEAPRFVVLLPDDVTLMNVQGSTEQSWITKEEQGRKLLEVIPASPARGSYQLNVSYERALGGISAVADLAVPQALGVERETGYLAVEARTNVEVSQEEVSGLTRVDPRELPENLSRQAANPILLAYKFLKPPVRLRAQITRHEDVPVLVAAIEEARAETLVTDDGKLLTRAVYSIRNNTQQYLKLELPQGAQVWSALVAGQPTKPGQSGQTVLISLQRSGRLDSGFSTFQVELVYLVKAAELGKGKGSVELALPKADLPASKLLWSCYLPESYRYSKIEGNLQEASPSALAQFPTPPAPGKPAEAKEVLKGDRRVGQSSNIAYSGPAGPPAAEEGGVAVGMLPVLVSVPSYGVERKFAKFVVTQEAPNLRVDYQYAPKRK